MNMFHPPDLFASKGDDEIELTPLQLTRLRRSAISFQKFVIGALVFLLLAGGIAVFAVNKALNEIVAVRSEARHTECVRDNRRSDEAAASARAQAEVLIAAAKATGGARDPAINAAYVADSEAAARKLFPQRPCTPEAIDEYYRTKTP